MVVPGKYSVIGEENLIQHLKEAGIPEDQVKSGGQFSIEIKQDGNKFTITKTVNNKSSDISFNIGEEFEEEFFGRKVKFNAKLNGDVLVISNGDHTRTFNFTSTGLEIVYKSSKSTAKLIFKKV
ncbi:unnamed protein product [Diabrotica balteata]|uniref:Uncharacterized protein n=1 Tax=Diabrotica balteata TaxID=107213 RepID=A0A9N9SZ42_DIABA|nr:unnamed protein product [Diabrotica balteata]